MLDMSTIRLHKLHILYVMEMTKNSQFVGAG